VVRIFCSWPMRLESSGMSFRVSGYYRCRVLRKSVSFGPSHAGTEDEWVIDPSFRGLRACGQVANVRMPHLATATSPTRSLSLSLSLSLSHPLRPPPRQPGSGHPRGAYFVLLLAVYQFIFFLMSSFALARTSCSLGFLHQILL
jgi:hypothetical protein